jgi:hypothetical protein
MTPPRQGHRRQDSDEAGRDSQLQDQIMILGIQAILRKTRILQGFPPQRW